MRETVSRFGIPMAAYADRHSIFYQGREVHLRKLSLEEQLAGHSGRAQRTMAPGAESSLATSDRCSTPSYIPLKNDSPK